MNLEEFHTLVDDEAGEGGAVNQQIPGCVRRAVRWLERNYDFRYMEQTFTFNITTANDPAPINLGAFVKNISGGEVREAGSIVGTKLVKFTRDRFAVLDDEEFEGKLPVLVYGDGQDNTWIKVLLPVTTAFDLAVTIIQYTNNWPTTGFISYLHPLLDRGEDVLLARTLYNLSRTTRDPELRALAEADFTTAIKTLLDSEFMLEYGL